MARTPVHWSQRSRRTTDSPINYFIREAVEKPNLISLAAGLVDYSSLPAAEIAEATAAVLADANTAQAALQYGTTHGLASLRQLLLARIVQMDGITASDISVSADDLVVTTGSQQLLYLLSELLLDPGDLVITEAPSYFVFQGTLQSAGVRTLTVPMDEHGLDIDALEDLLQRLERSGELQRLRLIYVVDYFQNPTGLSLALPRRQRLVELVRHYSRKQRIFIVEDAAYRELRYDGPDLPSLKRFDEDNQHVILAMTFSKPLAPGLKTGYGLLPRELVAPLLHLKGNHDFGSSNLTQYVLERVLTTGAYDRHLTQLCAVYRAKRDALLAALAEVFPPELGVRWTQPRGGLYVWLTFPPDVDTGPGGELMRAALREEVLYVPGPFCYRDGATPVPRHEARLSFGVASIAQIREAVRRLGCAYRTVAERNSRQIQRTACPS